MSIRDILLELRLKIKNEIRTLVMETKYDQEKAVLLDDIELKDIIGGVIPTIEESIGWFNNQPTDDSEESQFQADICQDIHDSFLLEDLMSLNQYNPIEKLKSLNIAKRGENYISEYNSVIEELLVRYHKALIHVESEIHNFDHPEENPIHHLKLFEGMIDDLAREQKETNEMVKKMSNSLKL